MLHFRHLGPCLAAAAAVTWLVGAGAGPLEADLIRLDYDSRGPAKLQPSASTERT
jgi:hypothetical protein